MTTKSKNIKRFNRLVAIELSEENITCTEVQFLNGLINITGGFKIDIPVFSDLNKTIGVLKQSLKTSNIKTKDVVFGLSMQYFKLFPVPIPNSIPLNEVSQIIVQDGNVNVASENVSYLPLTTTQRQEADGVVRYDVLGISMEKRLIDICTLISSKCALTLHSITPSFLALSAYLGNQNNNLISTLWISQVKSEFVVWSQKEPIYEHLILTYQLKDQVSQTINFIQSQIPGSQIGSVYTCGPNAINVDLSTLPFNFKSFTLTENIKDTAKLLQKYSIADLITPIGLAITGSNNTPIVLPNLLEGSHQDTSKASDSKFSKSAFKAQKKEKNPLAGYMSLATLVFIISLISIFYVKSVLLSSAQSNVSKITSKLSQSQLQITKVMNQKKSNAALLMKVDYLSQLIDKRTPWSAIFREVGGMAPKNLWIDKMEIRGNKIDIFGRSLDVDSVANFSINLNYSSKLLKNAQIIALRKIQENELDFVDFQVTVLSKDDAYLIAKKEESNELQEKDAIENMTELQ